MTTEAGRVGLCVANIRDTIEELDCGDELEAEHRLDALAWLAQTDDVFRRRSPDVPDKHLVSYIAVVDPDSSALLLVDHRTAGLWLPAGGHVEVGEDPWLTVQREAAEELFLQASAAPGFGREPAFLTVTRTRGPSSHTDVSLWFVLTATPADVVRHDQREFNGVRWWTPEEIMDADPTTLDPHLPRFVTKLTLHR
jgi:8-oxo-dGTP diphosphatase